MKEYFCSKKKFKQTAGRCAICHEDDYNLLDVHRWAIEGANGGKYEIGNCICLCTSCHRLLHAGKITIHGIYQSTKSKVVHFTDSSGKENFEFI